MESLCKRASGWGSFRMIFSSFIFPCPDQKFIYGIETHAQNFGDGIHTQIDHIFQGNHDLGFGRQIGMRAGK